MRRSSDPPITLSLLLLFLLACAYAPLQLTSSSSSSSSPSPSPSSSSSSCWPSEAAPTASGYLTIDATKGSKMFFSFYESTEPWESEEEIPILLWLQGGPGCSSSIGNFYELGPWRVSEDSCLHPNPYPWNRIFGLLFLDNPIGAGFSIAPSVEDIPTDQQEVAHDVYVALERFYERFPSFRIRPFYVTGESYAGKYAPSVATYILRKQDEDEEKKMIHVLARRGGGAGHDRHPYHQENSSRGLHLSSSSPLRLDGVAIGNGLTHPVVQVRYNAPTAYYMGLMDEHQTSEAGDLATKVVDLIEEENWEDAQTARVNLLHYIKNVTGLATLLDARRGVEYYTSETGEDYLTRFMNNEEMQASLLNIGPLKWESCSDAVLGRLGSDVPKSVKSSVEELLNRSIPVLLYQGQFDLQDGVASSEAWIRHLEWDGLDRFYGSDRRIWKESVGVLGYVRSHSALTHVVVSNSGHLVPADQAYASQRMIEGWISSKGII